MEKLLTGNLNQLEPHLDKDTNLPVFTDSDGDNILEDDMLNYFIDEFLEKPLKEDTTLEKYYEIAKFTGRVKNFLSKSHFVVWKNYDYTWGQTPKNGGRPLGDIIYDILTNSSVNLGAPENTAANQIYNLDRYIDVAKYREELIEFSERINFLKIFKHLVIYPIK